MKPIKSINLSAPAGATRLSFGRIRSMLLLFVAALLFSTQLTFAGTKEMEASSKLKNALSKEFSGASDVKWYSEDNKTFMAKFTLKERNVTAYFDKEGTLLATRRYIAEEHLPMAVTNKLAKRYPNEKVRWVVEFESDGNTVYYVTLEGDKTWKVIKSSAGGDMSVHQHLKKV
ncbi:hypothetical protein SAMN05428949_3247 [Chitinophaga sp. YR627]|uniref:hypothetical protein n=1 Tax=Chitinophaga sp. YR627 TaxID=1881041 RepID=UPI0008E7B798|nr:hypothetical protein [Chitinophaga sp. YR627]SFN71755.1 hypothetical protein SAMN05428949_3247 [Chitinophaga sp. YR627]